MATDDRIDPAELELVPLTAGDEWLTAAIETDPEMMAELGGPVDPAGIPAIHARRVRGVEDGSIWFDVIRVGRDGPAVGTVCVWSDADRGGGHDSEIGWGVLRAWQGRGIATAAVRKVLARAREDGRWGRIHAFPAVTNEPSNRLAEAAGFRLVGQVDVEFRGRPLHCNDWVIDAARTGAGATTERPLPRA